MDSITTKGTLSIDAEKQEARANVVYDGVRLEMPNPLRSPLKASKDTSVDIEFEIPETVSPRDIDILPKEFFSGGRYGVKLFIHGHEDLQIDFSLEQLNLISSE